MSAENAMIRRKVFLLRYSATKSREVEKVLTALYERLQARIIREPSEFRVNRLTILRNDISILLQQGFDDVTREMYAIADEIGLDEGAFLTKTMNLETNVILTAPDASIIERALRIDSMDVLIGSGELTMGEALAQFTANKTREIQTIIADGILLGEATESVAQRIALEAKLRPINQVRSLTRTLVSHATSSAQKTFAKQNASILEGEEWSATLDGRTTRLCAGRDGNVYPVGKGPYPPAHWNCRSLRIMIVKNEYATQDQTLQRDDFDSWLRKQSPAFQDEYFSSSPNGPVMAKLFRENGLEIQEFRDETGKDLSLQMLQGLEPITLSDIINP
jgi:hypothetical protein